MRYQTPIPGVYSIMGNASWVDGKGWMVGDAPIHITNLPFFHILSFASAHHDGMTIYISSYSNKLREKALSMLLMGAVLLEICASSIPPTYPPSDASRLRGNRTVFLAVHVFLNDAAYNHTSQAGLSDDISGNGRDLHNLQSQYDACSFGQLIFNKASDRNMTIDPKDGTTAIASGVVDVKVDLNVTTGWVTIADAVNDKINTLFGVTSPNHLADHVMYCLPSGAMDSFGKTIYSSWWSMYSNEWCSSLYVQMHEVRCS